jgi:putative redox protein
MQTLRLRFPGATGAQLAARLERPTAEPLAYALFAHCFTCGKDLKAAGAVSRALAERGIAVLRFDFTGLGESEGDFADTSFSGNVDDLVAAADFLRREHRAPRLLVGHSLGGAAVLAAAHRVPESVAVATLGAPSDTAHLSGLLLAAAPELATAEVAPDQGVEVELAGRRFLLKRQFLEDLQRDHLRSRVASLGRALLILHSPVDEIVGIEHARRLYEAARHPKSFVSLDDADHLLKRARDARYAAEVLAAWAGRYLSSQDQSGGAEAKAGGAAPAAGREGAVVVSGGADGYSLEIRARRHLLRSDEPEEVGGADTGPTPYELLLSALGACTTLTLRMYADRKGWPLEGIEMALAHAKIHAADCAECETREGMIDRIQGELRLSGPLDAEQRRRLLEIAHKCPVHRTLKGEIDIPLRLGDGT